MHADTCTMAITMECKAMHACARSFTYTLAFYSL